MENSMNQEIVHGINNLPDIIKKIGAMKIILVVDSSFSFLNIKKDIEGLSVPYVIFDQFTPNPLYEDVCKGVDTFNAEVCDTILAVGGGSSIDLAKCIKLYCKMDRSQNYLQQEYKDSGVTLIAIPTTAGTGSESTRYAVIYYDGKKQSVTHDSIVPNFAILEPSVLKTLPLYQKKCTILDALCQGIESFWSINSTDESKEYSKAAISGIIANWKEYIFNNSDEAAKAIMIASNYAGKAICTTQTTAAHAFSYKITSLYKLPHGHAVAVCLPVIWNYMIEHMDRCIDKRGVDYLSDIFNQIAEKMGVATPQEAIDYFTTMMRRMDIKQPKGRDINYELNILSKSVNQIRLKNNPVCFNSEVIKSLYYQIIN